MPAEGAGITVLFAEDEVPLRELFRKFLEDSGFTVLPAGDGREAMEIAQRYEGKIDVLISDIQMPQMTGPELAKALQTSRPDVKVMLMSGYTEGVLAMEESWVFVAKPVGPRQLVQKVYEVLHQPPAPQAGAGSSPAC